MNGGAAFRNLRILVIMLRTIGDLLGYGALLYEKGNGMGIKAVVFDMDGTILHTLPDLTVVTLV